jgi:hypothetical protein
VDHTQETLRGKAHVDDVVVVVVAAVVAANVKRESFHASFVPYSCFVKSFKLALLLVCFSFGVI